MHSETTRILRPDGAARVAARQEAQRIELAHVERRAVQTLLREGWTVHYDRSGDWSATREVASV